MDSNCQDKIRSLLVAIMKDEITVQDAAKSCTDDEQMRLLCEIETFAGELAREAHQRGLAVPDRPPFKLPKPI
jgi:hypothetical protein